MRLARAWISSVVVAAWAGWAAVGWAQGGSSCRVDPGRADSADCGYYEHDGTGSVHTTFSCEPEQTRENLDTIRTILRDAQRDGITEDELNQAKSKIASRVVRGSERPMGRVRAVRRPAPRPRSLPPAGNRRGPGTPT